MLLLLDRTAELLVIYAVWLDRLYIADMSESLRLKVRFALEILIIIFFF